MKPPSPQTSYSRWDVYDEILYMLLPFVGIALAALLAVAAAIYPALWLLVALDGASLNMSVVDVAKALVDVVRTPSDPHAAFGAAGTHLPPAWILYPVLLLSIGAALALVAWLVSRVSSRRKRRASPDASSFASARSLGSAIGTLAQLQGARGRVILGRVRRNRYFATKDFSSVIVFGPSGSGKTTGFAEPAIVEHDGPGLVLSMKMDLAANTIEIRDRIAGGRALVYDPTHATSLPDKYRCAWSPLARCQTWSGAKRMASWLTSVGTGLVGADDKFWRDNAALLLEPALFVFANTQDATMRDVVGWIQTTAGDEMNDRWARALAAVQSELSARDDDDAKALQSSLKMAADQMNGILAWDERTLGSTRTTALNTLKAYTDPDLLDCTAAQSVNISALLDGPNTLYLAAPASEQELMRPVLAAMVKDVLHEAFARANRNLTGALNEPLLVVLDEVANIAPIPDLDVLASTCRSHAINLVTLTQSYSQLVDRWSGPRARTIFDNHTAKVLLRGSTDAELLQQFRRLVGERVERRTTRSRNDRGQVSTSEQLRDRSLALEHELRSLDIGTGMVLYGANEPALVKLRPFYSDPIFSEHRAINDEARRERTA
jgi:type IV secretion system protein VirD4